MKRIKILYISHSSLIGGAERCLSTLVKYLDKSIFDPVVVFPSGGPLIDEIRESGTSTYISPFEWWVRVPNDFRVTNNDMHSRLESLSEIIEREKPDLIHTNTSVIWEGALCARKHDIPHIWHIHEILEGHPRLKALLPLNLVYWMMDQLSERFVVVSNAVRETIPTFVDGKKVITIYNGIDTNTFRPGKDLSLREELSVPKNVSLAVSIGSLVEEKGYDNLIEAIAIVIKESRDVKFLIVGEGLHETVQAMQTKLKTLGLLEHVSYLGYRKDIPRVLFSSNFLILSSITEAFPLVALEAMAAGKPVIATNCGGISEMISDGESGFLVPVNDPKALSQKILYMIRNRNQTEEMGRRAIKEVTARYSVESYTNHFENLYREIYKNGKGRRYSEEESLLLNALTEVYEDLERNSDDIF